jgi:hypothetical protein
MFLLVTAPKYIAAAAPDLELTACQVNLQMFAALLDLLQCLFDETRKQTGDRTCFTDREARPEQ